MSNCASPFAKRNLERCRLRHPPKRELKSVTQGRQGWFVPSDIERPAAVFKAIKYSKLLIYDKMTSLDEGANSLVGPEQEREEESHGLVGYHVIEIFVLNRPTSHRFVGLLVEPCLSPREFLVYLRRRLLAKSFIVPNLKRIVHSSINPSFPAGPSKQVFPCFKPPVLSIEI